MPTIAIIAPSSVPFQIGGAEKFWWGLHVALSRYSDNHVELLKLPCHEGTFAELVDAYRLFSELDLTHFDMVISTKYPAWMVRHPKHVVYMQHTLRGLYDTYHFTGLPETLSPVPAPLRELTALLRTPRPTRDDLAKAFALLHRAQNTKSLPSSLFALPGPLLRETVHFFDRVALAPEHIAAYLAISATVRQRKDYFPPQVGADADVSAEMSAGPDVSAGVKILHHPSDITAYACAAGEYIFTASRLTSMKRLHLLVEAMRYVTVDIPLKIAGTGPEMAHLQALAGGDRRIEFLGYVPDADMPQLYSRALFVPFVPYDEDYGLITIEAMHSGKPVLTTTDAGGVCEFVENGVTGLCTAPTPEALGAAMQRLAASPELAADMGAKARQRVAAITWETTVRELLAHAASSAAKRAQGTRKSVLVCSTFPASDPVSGGQQRLYQLCRALAKTFFVHLLCFGPQTQRGSCTKEILPCVQETRLPWSSEGIQEAARLAERTESSAEDVALMRTCAQHPLLQEALAAHAHAGCRVASHPYLFPAMQAILPDIPLVYDAHNVEMDMKTAVFGDGHPELLCDVFCVEEQCARTAQQVLTCAEHDTQRFMELYALPSTHFLCVPNGCDCTSVLFTGAEERRALRRRLDYPEAKLALFIGSGHKPNIAAAGHIFAMADAVPEVQFLLAGSVSTQTAVRDWKRPANVHLLGILSDAVKNVLLRAANIGLNPMTSGSGTNLKIIESLVAGLETVSTPFGVRGLDAENCASIHVRALEDFPQAIRQALAHPPPAHVLAAASRRAVQCFAWSAVMRPVSALIATIMDKAKG